MIFIATTDRNCLCSKTLNFARNFTPKKQFLRTHITGEMNATNMGASLAPGGGKMRDLGNEVDRE